jgi:hypothetical protein
MWQRRRRMRALLGWGATLAALALCASLSYSWGLVGNIAYTGYYNTSHPLLTTQAGVLLEVAHSHYVTLEAITLTLVNRSRAPIYLPALTANLYGADPYAHPLAPPDCTALETDIQRAQGWQVLGRGCNWSWSCPGGEARAPPHPAVLILEPGETARFPVYAGQDTYPPWSSGTYRFSVLYSATAFVAPHTWGWSYPLVIPHGVTQWSAPVTLTMTWGYPSSYHQTAPSCGVAA